MVLAILESEWAIMPTRGDQRPSFGGLLRRARRAAELTQEELAERAGLSVRGISDLERGVRRAPRRDTLEFLADALSLSDAERRLWERVRREANRSSISTNIQPLQPPALIGRQREFALLRDAFERGIAGAGQVCVASGDPGVGKTRLAESLMWYSHTRDTRVLWGSCDEAEGAPAYWPWIQIIRAMIDVLAPDVLQRDLGRGASQVASLVPEIADHLPGVLTLHDAKPEQTRFQLFDSIARFMRSASLRTPILLILDDLHRADQSSLELLTFLARHITSSRIVILGTYRAHELEFVPELGWTVAELSRMLHFQHLSIGGLSQHAVEQLVEQVTGQPARKQVLDVIYKRTEGNPFFVSELARLLIASDRDDSSVDINTALDAIPPGVKGVLEQRFRRLETHGYETLVAASVAGREFNLSLLSALVDQPRKHLLAALDEALRARLIQRMSGSVGRYRFSHALIRETLYESLSSAERVTLHHRIGEFVEQAFSDDVAPYLGVLAHHFFEAIPGFGTDKAIDYAIQAGSRAVAQFAYTEAVKHFERALEALDLSAQVDSEMRCEVLLKLGDACSQAGQYRAAQEAFTRAAEISQALNHTEYFARAAIGAAGLGQIEHSEAHHLQLLEKAVAFTGEESLLRAQALARLAITLQEPETLERRSVLAEEAETIARKSGDDVALLNALLAKHRTLWVPARRDQRLAVARELDYLLGELGSHTALPVLPYRMYDHLEVGEISAVDALIESFSVQADELQQPQRTWIVTNLRVSRALLGGRLHDAQQLNDQARAIGEPAAPALAEADYVMFDIFLRREWGQLDEIADAVRQSAARFRDDIFWRTLLILQESSFNSSSNYRSSIDEVLASIERHSSRDSRALVAATLLAMESHLTRDRNIAERLYGVLTPFAHVNAVLPNSRTFLCLGSISYPLGLLAHALGCWHTADQYFSRALTANERSGARVFAAYTRLAWGLTLLQRGNSSDRRKARKLFREAGMAASDMNLAILSREVARATG